MNKVERAMMICVGCKDWFMPKHILVSTDERHGKMLNEIAEKAFETYKSTQENKDIYLVDYSYYGNVEIFNK